MAPPTLEERDQFNQYLALEKRPTYPAYRSVSDSCHLRIPLHWSVNRLRFLCRLNPNKSEIGPVPAATNVSFLPMELIGEDGSLALSEVRKIGDLIDGGYTYFRNGDVLIAKITPCFENGKGALCRDLVGGIGFGTTELHVLRPLPSLESRFLFYSARTDEFSKLGKAAMYGAAGQQRVPEDFIKDFLIAVPPLDEQRIIAAYLDRETAKIDALVAKKQRLIELLQEKRAALISHAVTKGLDPSVPMKDSGVEWLGLIPAHWQVQPVWMLFKLGRGRVISHGEIIDHPGPYPVYSSQTENDGVMGYLSTYDFEGEYLSWTTDGAKAGTVFRRQGRFNCTNVCGTLLPKSPLTSLSYQRDALNLATSWFVRHDINPKLMNNVMARIRVPVPPKKEQHAVSGYLQSHAGRIDQLVAKISQHIERLQEYRTALISAAVTGKIDVRGEVDMA